MDALTRAVVEAARLCVAAEEALHGDFAVADVLTVGATMRGLRSALRALDATPAEPVPAGLPAEVWALRSPRGSVVINAMGGKPAVENGFALHRYVLADAAPAEPEAAGTDWADRLRLADLVRTFAYEMDSSRFAPRLTLGQWNAFAAMRADVGVTPMQEWRRPAPDDDRLAALEEVARVAESYVAQLDSGRAGSRMFALRAALSRLRGEPDGTPVTSAMPGHRWARQDDPYQLCVVCGVCRADVGGYGQPCPALSRLRGEP